MTARGVPARRNRQAAHPDFLALRRAEFARLDSAGHAYLDYTGAGLYTATQVERHHRRLLHDVLGNPHSANPASAASTERIEAARRRVLAFLSADPAEYEVVFTANATAALRLVGESFPFAPGSRFVLTADNHNSVNGIRCFAGRAGAAVHYIQLDASLRCADPLPGMQSAPRDRRHLFAFPAQSNFSGVQHPLAWIEQAAAHGHHVLLDAAAYAPTSPLRLDEVRADFVCLSFYKMFGHPTGIGALVARREALALLRRPWFAGGTVEWVSTFDRGHERRAGAEAFEDGTPHFLAADAICDGLDLLENLGMERVASHVREQTSNLIDALLRLEHPNGTPMIEIYGPHDLTARGGTVAFGVRDAAGTVLPFETIVAAAASQRVSVRGGCFCNPGCAEASLQMDMIRARSCRDTMRGRYQHERFIDCMNGPVGAVRASVGVPTVAGDIDRLVRVLARFRGFRAAGHGTPPVGSGSYVETIGSIPDDRLE